MNNAESFILLKNFLSVFLNFFLGIIRTHIISGVHKDKMIITLNQYSLLTHYLFIIKMIFRVFAKDENSSTQF